MAYSSFGIFPILQEGGSWSSLTMVSPRRLVTVTGLGGISGPNVQSFFTALAGALLLLLATRWLFGKAA